VGEITAFHGADDGPSRIDRVVAISSTATALWLSHVARFYLVSVDCDGASIVLVLTEYHRDHRTPVARPAVLAWHVQDADDDASTLHEAVRRDLGGTRIGRTR
jgi:hypothetical protein